MDFAPCHLVAFFHDMVFIKKHEDLEKKSIIITEPQMIKKRKTKQNKTRHISMYSDISIFLVLCLNYQKTKWIDDLGVGEIKIRFLVFHSAFQKPHSF